MHIESFADVSKNLTGERRNFLPAARIYTCVLLLWTIVALGWLAIALLAVALFRVASYADMKVRRGNAKGSVKPIAITGWRAESRHKPAA